MSAQVCIVGVGESDSGHLPHKSALQLHQQAAHAALDDAGLRPHDVDGLFTCGDEWAHALLVAEYLGLHPTYVDSTQVGGASWEFLVGHAVAALAAGRCTTALLVYGGTPRSDALRRRRPPEHAVRGPAQFEAVYGLTVVGKYALAARRHMHDYGTTSRQLAAVALAANRWAQLNPRALHHGHPLTIDDALRSRMVAEPLRQADCCVWTDGGGAVVLTTAERARDLRGGPVPGLGTGEAVSHLHLSQWDSMPDLVAAAASGRRAFEQAGVSPRDVDVLQVYDSVTIMVLLTLEALGFCEGGASGALAESGALEPGGALPTNTDGGGLAANHPGTRGIFLLIEAARQLRGDAGSRQVPNARIALCTGTGGFLSACGTVVLGT